MEEKNNNKNELTLEAIAKLIKASADETTKSLEAKIASSANETVKLLEAKIESSVGDLAIMTQNNFLKMEERLGNVENKLDKLDVDLKEAKSDTQNIKADINKKLDKITYNTLKYRVEKLEEKYA
jgi:hypothetical protein